MTFRHGDLWSLHSRDALANQEDITYAVRQHLISIPSSASRMMCLLGPTDAERKYPGGFQQRLG